MSLGGEANSRPRWVPVGSLSLPSTPLPQPRALLCCPSSSRSLHVSGQGRTQAVAGPQSAWADGGGGLVQYGTCSDLGTGAPSGRRRTKQPTKH